MQNVPALSCVIVRNRFCATAFMWKTVRKIVFHKQEED